MNTSKVWAYVLTAVVGVLNILQTMVPFIPSPWSQLVSAVLAVAIFYHVIQSHTQAALAASGYQKVP